MLGANDSKNGIRSDTLGNYRTLLLIPILLKSYVHIIIILYACQNYSNLIKKQNGGWFCKHRKDGNFNC